MKETISKNIRIKVNEKEIPVPSNTTLFSVKNQCKPNADVIIYNGFSLTSDRPLKQGDEIVFVDRGKPLLPKNSSV
jgi:sulfur carrier protein ThiS adenylyltransferase